ncbi:MAG: 30S ribosomal protein S2 [Chitinophagales bacterium]|nr:30S ribosomal protein S2 [Chitinophagales bacterium]
MEGIPHEQLLEAGAHFGHLRKKWNPKMLPYIFMEKKGIHIIDLNKTNESLVRAASAIKNIARSGRKILFVATKKQAKEVVTEAAKSVNMPYVTERWLGGMLTNFVTIRKSIKKMQNIQKMLDETGSGLTKKERLVLGRELEKLNRVLGGIEHLNRVPGALYLVDISHEHLALSEAKRMGLVTFGMVDTNSDPNEVDYAIPANDDASKSVALITNYMVEAIKAGLEERKAEKPDDNKEDEGVEFEERNRFYDKEDGDKDNRRNNNRRGGGGQGGGNNRTGGGQGGNRTGGGQGSNRTGGGQGGGNRTGGGQGGNRTGGGQGGGNRTGGGQGGNRTGGGGPRKN